MSETEKRKRVPSEASKKAAKVRQYFAAVEGQKRAQASVDKANRRLKLAKESVEALRVACDMVGVTVSAPE